MKICIEFTVENNEYHSNDLCTHNPSSLAALFSTLSKHEKKRLMSSPASRTVRAEAKWTASYPLNPYLRIRLSVSYINLSVTLIHRKSFHIRRNSVLTRSISDFEQRPSLQARLKADRTSGYERSDVKTISASSFRDLERSAFDSSKNHFTMLLLSK